MLVSIIAIHRTCALLLPLALLMATPLGAAASDEAINRLRGQSAPLYAEANDAAAIVGELTAVKEFLPVITRFPRGDDEWAAIKVGGKLYFVKVADVVIGRIPAGQQPRGRDTLDAGGRTLR